MLWFLIVLAGIGLTVQAWLTIRGFGPPSPQMGPYKVAEGLSVEGYGVS